MQKISYGEYLQGLEKKQFSQNFCLIDVRTPLEFKKGHICAAVNLPLFSNRQRAEVGTIYKQKGKEAAVLKGLKMVKMAKIARRAKTLSSSALIVYCARGGMRSQAVGWLLEFIGYRVFLLENGYKGYRRWVREQFAKSYPLTVVSGKTGAGKTTFLKKLDTGIDLEKLACHRGSVFGGYAKPQPSQETFENRLADNLYKTAKKLRPCFLKDSRENSIWIEDESRKIGSIIIPDLFFRQMQKASRIILNSSFEKRLARLFLQYRRTPLFKLKEAVLKLEKHLGSERAGQVLWHLEKNEKKNACRLLLNYYDKKYSYTLEKRKNQVVQTIPQP